ncbi:hypothetical protein, partial [Thauera sp.]|uniref:hypothetical protein n=1 Tax=Thauera sp. TaxID=1905334 RepID=UPI002C80AF09
SMGTSAMRVFGQQAPQILAGFGPLGIAIGAAAAALPLLASAMSDAGDEALALDGITKTLSDTLGVLKAAGFEVAEATDLFSGALRSLAETGATSAIRDLQQQLSDMVADITRVVPGTQGSLAIVSGVEQLQEALGLTEEQAQRLFDAITRLAGAPMDQVATAAQALANTIAGIADETGQITPEMAAIRDAAIGAGQAAATLADNTGAARAQAQGLAGDWQTVLANAQGAMMAAGQALAATERARVAQQQINSSRPTSFGGALGTGAGDYPLSGVPPTRSSVMDAQFPIYGSPLTAPTATSRGGGGRGGGGGIDRAAAEEQRRIQQAIRDGIRDVAQAQRELQRENEKTAETFADIFVSAIDGSRSLEDSLRSLASQIAKTFIQSGIEGLLNSGGGGIFGAIFGGGRASGGPVRAGTSYLVGERGPEIFTPRASGTITPNGAGGAVDVRVYVDQDGNWRAAVANIAGPVSARAVQRLAPSTVANASRRMG